MSPQRTRFLFARWLVLVGIVIITNGVQGAQQDHSHHGEQERIDFSIRSVASGSWSDPSIWEPRRIPREGDRVLIQPSTTVTYDRVGDEVIRLIQIVGVLSFAKDCDTELNVGLIVITHDAHCAEDGFACEFEGAAFAPETAHADYPALLIGTKSSPIPAAYNATVRLHFVEGMDPDNAPAIACCGGRFEVHGTPLANTWVKLADDAPGGSSEIMVDQPMDGWRVGDAVIITASERRSPGRTYRNNDDVQTEERRIDRIDDGIIVLDRPLDHDHAGTGEFRSELANLSRNVTIESADPDGVRGHTVYHRFSQGGISYARFAHLGKEGVLGRYAIHYHLVGDTMRGSEVQGAAIVDSHNRWLTIHGTHYLVVRDCVGYQSVGHGYFLEDGTEVYNLLDHNLGVQAYKGQRLPDQILSFDPNDGAAFWWANGRNSLTRNVAVENDQYGYRFDIQHTSRFDARLPIRQPDGDTSVVDVRTIGVWRFEDNESHSEGLYGAVFAANGSRQPDSAVRDQQMLDRIKQIDWTAPDVSHPHTIRGLTIWETHYGLRPQSPAMLMEDVRIDRAAYGIYRPAFENHVYRNLHLSDIAAEPFNRGMDDASAQTGVITVDGLTFETAYGNRSTPLIQISDLNLSGDAATHLRNVQVHRHEQFLDRWPLVNRGVGPRVEPLTDGVPIFIHDYYGTGRDAKVVSTAAKDLLADGNEYTEAPPLTSNESRITEVEDVAWPTVLQPVDDLPPATIILHVRAQGQVMEVSGVSHDDGEIESVAVNHQAAEILSRDSGVVRWRVELPYDDLQEITAWAVDRAGNIEGTPHVRRLDQN